MRFTPHTIVPSEFEYLDSYDLGNSEDPPFNVTTVNQLIDKHGEAEGFEHLGKCCVCGTPFRYGDVWLHEPSGKCIVIGWRCAAKYGLMASRSDYKGKRASHIKKLERLAERRRVRGEMKKFLRMHPKLRGQLRYDHPFIRTIRASFVRWGNLTEPQMQAIDKVIRETEVHRKAEVELGPPIAVREGRYEMTGTVVGMKWQKGYMPGAADTLKMVVRVDGWYKVYGTCPEQLSDQIWRISQRDDEFSGGVAQWVRQHPVRVKFTATVTQSDDDEHFGFFKRPSKAEVLS